MTTLDEILASEKLEVVAKARKKADTMLLNIHLTELRRHVQKLRQAKSLKLTHPTQPS